MQIDLDLDSILAPEQPKKSAESDVLKKNVNPKPNSKNSRTSTSKSGKRSPAAKTSSPAPNAKPKEERASTPVEEILESAENDSDWEENLLDANFGAFDFVPMNMGAVDDAGDSEEGLSENGQPGIEGEIDIEIQTE